MPKLPYKYYLLMVLTTVAVFNFFDRFVLSLLLEPIKQDFQLSDSQLGLLTGFAFAFFYAVAGVPIARWADRGNRNTIVSLTTGLWSCMVALSGLVGNFYQLLLVRVGVAVGEAGCIPPAQSWLADYFSRAERPRAMAIYHMSYPVAVFVGYLGGGWLAETLGWRTTFIVMGLPGVLLALLVRFTLPEPRLQQASASQPVAPAFKTVLVTLWQQRTFVHIVKAFVMAYVFGAGIFIWMPTFFIRSHGMSIAEIGTWLAITSGVCGILGTYLGGELASRLAAHKESLQMRAASVLFALSSLLYVAAFLVPNKYLALVCIASVTFVGGLKSSWVFSSLQSLIPSQMRSVAVALVFLLANLIGGGVGPLLTGVMSDVLVPTLGSDSLRYALLLLSPGYCWVAYHYWQAGKTIEVDIDVVASQESDTAADANNTGDTSNTDNTAPTAATRPSQ